MGLGKGKKEQNKQEESGTCGTQLENGWFKVTNYWVFSPRQEMLGRFRRSGVTSAVPLPAGSEASPWADVRGGPVIRVQRPPRDPQPYLRIRQGTPPPCPKTSRFVNAAHVRLGSQQLQLHSPGSEGPRSPWPASLGIPLCHADPLQGHEEPSSLARGTSQLGGGVSCPGRGHSPTC